MSEAIKRNMFMVYMNTTPNETTEKYSLVGDGVTELEISYNPETKEEQYINNDTASTYVTGYKPTASVSATCMKGDGVFEFVNGIRKNRRIMDESKTEILLIDVFGRTDNGSDNKNATSCPAEKQDVNIQIDSYGGGAEDPLKISYTINFKGDAKVGTVTLANEVPTFTETKTPTT